MFPYSDKPMSELRAICRLFRVKPARTKAETIARLVAAEPAMRARVAAVSSVPLPEWKGREVTAAEMQAAEKELAARHAGSRREDSMPSYAEYPMPELRLLSRVRGIKPAQTKAETIARLVAAEPAMRARVAEREAADAMEWQEREAASSAVAEVQAGIREDIESGRDSGFPDLTKPE